MWQLAIGMATVVVFSTPLTWLAAWYGARRVGDLSRGYHRLATFMYSLVTWYTVMVGLVFFGGNTWLGAMLSILYVIGLGVWGVGLLSRRAGATVRHVTDVPAASGIPPVGVDEYTRLKAKRDTLRIQRASGMR
jgi:hypothetical protein